MRVEGKVVIVTGAASGIGKALCERFAAEGARAVVAADLNLAGAEATAAGVGGLGLKADVGKAEDVKALVDKAQAQFGRIDLFCSNAGVVTMDPDPDNSGSAPDSAWMRDFGVNVLAHVFAARYALPGMIARGEGYFLNTVSAAGLLSQIGSAVYSTTKHAAIGFAENLAINHRRHGIGVSVLCPQAVDTPMLGGAGGAESVDGVLSPATVAGVVVEGLETERFLILPHEQVSTYVQRKTADYDRWLKGMARLRDAVAGAPGVG